MTIVINDDNLKLKDIKEEKEKVRALLIDDNNILVVNYYDAYLLPGGKKEDNEKNKNSLIRELKEEVGKNYLKNELKYLTKVIYYQKDYPTRDKKIINRLIKTSYFVSKYKGIGKQSLTEKEMQDNFKLELVKIKDLENIIINNKNNNPRNIFLKKELLKILEYYQNNRGKYEN